MPPAARISDMHVCPLFNGPVPHVGGPIIGPGAPTVLIGGVPAAVVGDSVTCERVNYCHDWWKTCCSIRRSNSTRWQHCFRFTDGYDWVMSKCLFSKYLTSTNHA